MSASGQSGPLVLNYNLSALDMVYPKFIVLNQKEESISIQRVNI